jgi:hypothetical protein
MRGTFLAAAAGMQPGLNCTAGRLSNQNRACTVGWGSTAVRLYGTSPPHIFVHISGLSAPYLLYAYTFR